LKIKPEKGDYTAFEELLPHSSEDGPKVKFTLSNNISSPAFREQCREGM
jgi:hypothetical protein